ncbi:MAG: EF-hand domain-containing protein [Chloroflexi bacterium]|nr:EF-hand domain-containing protein [Chloroflexota bacterium]
MLSDLRRRKLTTLFNLYDANRRGFVEEEDYKRIAQSIAKFLGAQPGTPEYDKLDAQYMAVWQNLRQMADKDNDNRVTLAEYLASWEELTSQRDVFAGLVMSLSENIIEMEDTDKDGRVSIQEYVTYSVHHNINGQDAENSFRRLDRDGNGYLSKEELLQNIEEFFLSEEPNAAGNWLVGPY